MGFKKLKDIFSESNKGLGLGIGRGDLMCWRGDSATWMMVLVVRQLGFWDLIWILGLAFKRLSIRCGR